MGSDLCNIERIQAALDRQGGRYRVLPGCVHEGHRCGEPALGRAHAAARKWRGQAACGTDSGGPCGARPSHPDRRPSLGSGVRRHRSATPMSSIPGSNPVTEQPSEPNPEAEPAAVTVADPAKAKINWIAEVRGLALMLLGVL